MARAEHLVSYGVPVIARILSADNLTGDSTYARLVKYQVVMPGGEMAHRTVNADERLLPSRVPADATALMDVSTSEVELYCALPVKAAIATAPTSRIPVAVNPTYAASATSMPLPAATPAAAPAGFAGLPVAEAPAAGGMGTMASLGGGRAAPAQMPQTPAPQAAAPSPAPEPVAEPAPKAAPSPETAPTPPPPASKPADKPAGSSGLPWE
jgi:hypothetical protein